MKVIHLCSPILGVFDEAVKGTGYCISGHKSIELLATSLVKFNARDVLGLVIHGKSLSKRMWETAVRFDELFELTPRPVILCADDISRRKLALSYCPLYLVDTVYGTLSDKDVTDILVTLSLESDEIYQLPIVQNLRDSASEVATPIPEMLSELDYLYREVSLN